MKKRIFMLLAFILLIGSMSIGMAMAENKDLLVDDADLLTDDEEDELEERLEELSDTYDFDVVIVTVESLGDKTATEYADDYFDYNGYGRGENGKDGVLFLRDAGDRYYAMSASGEYGKSVFSNSVCDDICGDMVGDLGINNYYEAFDSYIDGCEFELENYGKYDTVFWIIFGIVIGAIVGFIGAGISRGKLKSVAMQAAANNYYKPESFDVTDSKDMFLYRRVTRTAKPKDNSSHTSSSGNSHTGSSGRA